MQWINEYMRKELEEVNSAALMNSDDFRFWHVEPLLNQAAGLLDRCLAEHTLERNFEERFAQIQRDYEERTRRRQLEIKRMETNKVHRREGDAIQQQQTSSMLS